MRLEQAQLKALNLSLTICCSTDGVITLTQEATMFLLSTRASKSGLFGVHQQIIPGSAEARLRIPNAVSITRLGDFYGVASKGAA